MEYQLITLPNGIRIVFKYAPLPIAHACLLINAGTRDEPKGKFGLAHFIEHLLFKKTARRNTTQILNCLEVVGADLNAYTTKEYTCIHASFLNEHLARTLDLFEDITFHSEFPETEMHKEKGIILDEIASYQDSPEDIIADDFEDIIFDNHPLGHNILGTDESLISFTKKDIDEFIKQHYTPEGIVIGITSNHTVKKVKALCEKYFSDISHKTPSPKQKTQVRHQRREIRSVKPINQVHYMLGTVAYDIHHPYRIGLSLLNNLLGGMGMSNRLNMEIREKHGIAYTIESNYSAFSDTGIFTIYLGTDVDKINKADQLLFKELKKLRQKKLGTAQLNQAKQKFIGQIALGEENRIAVITSMAKNVLDYGYVESLEQIFLKIKNVQAEQIEEIANEVLHPEKLSSLLFIPADEESNFHLQKNSNFVG